MTGRSSERKRATVLVAALGAVLGAGLGACSVEVVQDEPQPSTGVAGTPTREPQSARTPGPGTDRPSPSAGTLDRRTLEAGATQHVTCGGGDLALTTAAAAVVVDDSCGWLAVEGAGVVVVAQDVERLTVEGSSVQVVVARVGSVELDAAAIRVAWEDGSPTVDDRGSGNSYGPVGTVDLDPGSDR